MNRQIPSLLELIFRIKLSKIAKERDLLSLLEMLLLIYALSFKLDMMGKII